jgi:hypothetical protein
MVWYIRSFFRQFFCTGNNHFLRKYEKIMSSRNVLLLNWTSISFFMVKQFHFNLSFHHHPPLVRTIHLDSQFNCETNIHICTYVYIYLCLLGWPDYSWLNSCSVFSIFCTETLCFVRTRITLIIIHTERNDLGVHIFPLANKTKEMVPEAFWGF